MLPLRPSLDVSSNQERNSRASDWPCIPLSPQRSKASNNNHDQTSTYHRSIVSPNHSPFVQGKMFLSSIAAPPTLENRLMGRHDLPYAAVSKLVAESRANQGLSPLETTEQLVNECEQRCAAQSSPVKSQQPTAPLSLSPQRRLQQQQYAEAETALREVEEVKPTPDAASAKKDALHIEAVLPVEDEQDEDEEVLIPKDEADVRFLHESAIELSPSEKDEAGCESASTAIEEHRDGEEEPVLTDPDGHTSQETTLSLIELPLSEKDEEAIEPAIPAKEEHRVDEEEPILTDHNVHQSQETALSNELSSFERSEEMRIAKVESWTDNTNCSASEGSLGAASSALAPAAKSSDPGLSDSAIVLSLGDVNDTELERDELGSVEETDGREDAHSTERCSGKETAPAAAAAPPLPPCQSAEDPSSLTSNTALTALSEAIPSVIYIRQASPEVPLDEPLETPLGLAPLKRPKSPKRAFLRKLRGSLLRSPAKSAAADKVRLSEMDEEAYEQTLVQI